MCGRYVSVSSPTILAERFHVDEVRLDEGAVDEVRARTKPSNPPVPIYPEPNYNVTPRAEVPVVAVSKGHRVLDRVRWGLVPSWAKSLAVGDKMINARAETLLTSNAYKRPFARRRCIVPADGFYEWQTIEGRKVRQPWFIKRRDGEPIAFAGLWSIWHDRKQGDDAPRVRSCAIITTEPNALMQPIHNRMPVILPESEWDTWLDAENDDVDALGKLLVPYAGDELEAWPVSTLVNKPVNNGPELIEAAPVDSRSR
jgi:putative SOS response-associated peptidase YedK